MMTNFMSEPWTARRSGLPVVRVRNPLHSNEWSTSLPNNRTHEKGNILLEG